MKDIREIHNPALNRLRKNMYLPQCIEGRGKGKLGEVSNREENL